MIPPVYFAGALLVMVVLHLLVPGPRWVETPLGYAGVVPILVAAWLGTNGARLFAKRGTAISPFEQPSALLTSGPYRYSRNPLYLSLVLTLFGIALFLGSLSSLVVVPLFMWLLTVRFIRKEERVLERRFGPHYQAYRHHVRRWFGRRMM